MLAEDFAASDLKQTAFTLRDRPDRNPAAQRSPILTRAGRAVGDHAQRRRVADDPRSCLTSSVQQSRVKQARMQAGKHGTRRLSGDVRIDGEYWRVSGPRLGTAT